MFLEGNEMLYAGEKLKEIAYSGWGEFEGGFVWSVAKYATLLMPIQPKNEPFGIQLVVEPFLVDGNLVEQSVEVFCNGLFVLGHVSDRAIKEILFVEIHPSLSNFGSLKIDFSFQNCKSPKDLGLSTDMRKLSYKLHEFQII
jgi:hypothetical protein